jgi:DNA-binding MarR family transcriptional regulator
MMTPPMNQIDQVLTSLRRVIRAIDLHSKQLVKTASVTGPQLRLLQLIRSQPGGTVKELADAMSLSQATVTSIMDRLESRGLIVRVRSQTDKRKIHPQLTDSGSALLDTAPTPLQDSFVRKFDQLQSWEQHMIIASLQRVAEMMDAEAIDASPFLDIGSLDRTEALEQPEAGDNK